MRGSGNPGGRGSYLLLTAVLVALVAASSCKTVPTQESPGVSATEEAGTVEDLSQPVQDRTAPVTPPELTKGQERFVLKELWAAVLLEQRGEHEAARLHYQRILDILPHSPHVLTRLAQSYLETNEIDLAVESAQKAIEADPTKAEAYEVLGRAYARQQKWAEAAEQYKRFLESSPRSVFALQQLADMQARAGNTDEAVNTYHRLIQVDPGRSGIYYYYIASLLMSTQRYSEAVEAFLRVLEEYPDRFDTYRQVGYLYQQLNRPNEAIDIYLRALGEGPSRQTEIILRGDLAQLYLRVGSRAEAYKQYARIHELSPTNTTALYFMSYLLLEDNQIDQASQQIDQLLALRPTDPQAVLLKCEILSRRQEWQQGADLFLGAFESVLEGTETTQRVQQDQFVAAVLKEGTRRLFARANRVDNLVAVLRRAHEKYPGNRAIPLALLIVQVEADREDEDLSKNIELVLEQWDAALSQDDGDSYQFYLVSLYDTGTLNYLATSSAGPIIHDILWRACEKFTDDAVSPLVLSSLRFNEGDWTAAEKASRLVVDRTEPTDPRHHMALQILGLTYEKLKRIDDAAGVIKRLIELTPESPIGYNMLGYLYADNNRNLTEAETLVKKALELKPDEGNFIDSLGWVYYRQGRHQEALQTLIEAKEKSQEEHPVIYDHLGDAYQATGHLQQAIEMWRKALEVGPRFPLDFTPELKQAIQDKIRAAEEHLQP